jgi:uncharacterized damage-inducible protein DinB
MTIARSLIGEFDHETANTRRVLERVPMEKYDWTPHPRSMSLGRLANHLATLVSWGSFAFTSDELDLSKTDYNPPDRHRREELLSDFDDYVAETRHVLEEASDELALSPWTLRDGEKVLFTLPRIAFVRSMVINHMIHHRAQLGVFLRLLDIPIPGPYGASADEI